MCRFISWLLILFHWSMSLYVPFCSIDLWVYASIYPSINTKLSWHCSYIALISVEWSLPLILLIIFVITGPIPFHINVRIKSSILCHWNSHCSLLAVENCLLGLRRSLLSWAIYFFQVEEGISPGYENTSCSRELIFTISLPPLPSCGVERTLWDALMRQNIPSHTFPDGREESQV